MSIVKQFEGRIRPTNSGPEQYAPRRRKPIDVDQAVSAVEGAIRDFVPRQISPPSQEWSNPDPANDAPARGLQDLIQQVANRSLEEIDRVIFELHGMREMLRREGERLGHEVVRYETLNRSAVSAMKIIVDSLEQNKAMRG